MRLSKSIICYSSVSAIKFLMTLLDKSKVDKLVQFGYPRHYVEEAVLGMEPNYCTAGYYLVDMLQNYC